MDDEDILQLVEDGELDSSDISAFRDLDDDIQSMVPNGEITADEALELG